MKVTSIIVIIFSVLFAYTVAYPAVKEEVFEQITWIDDLVKTVLDQSPSYIENYVPEHVRYRLARTGKIITKAVLRYALKN